MAQTNVLVVEDESIVSKDIQHSLKKLGYNVVGAASSGDQAVKLAVETMPDIILMDIMHRHDPLSKHFRRMQDLCGKTRGPRL